MYRHIATIDEDGICRGMWSGDWKGQRELKDNEVFVESPSVAWGKKYVDGEWVEYPQPEPEPTEEEIAQAEMLLMQVETLENQEAQDEVLAEILLNQMEV